VEKEKELLFLVKHREKLKRLLFRRGEETNENKKRRRNDG